jgi:hypothetical protein
MITYPKTAKRPGRGYAESEKSNWWAKEHHWYHEKIAGCLSPQSFEPSKGQIPVVRRMNSYRRNRKIWVVRLRWRPESRAAFKRHHGRRPEGGSIRGSSQASCRLQNAGPYVISMSISVPEPGTLILALLTSAVAGCAADSPMVEAGTQFFSTVD